MSDAWPIESVWAILKQDLGKVEVNDVKSLRMEIKRSWCQLSQDKELQAVVRKKGGQIFKSDYL